MADCTVCRCLNFFWTSESYSGLPAGTEDLHALQDDRCRPWRPLSQALEHHRLGVNCLIATWAVQVLRSAPGQSWWGLIMPTLQHSVPTRVHSTPAFCSVHRKAVLGTIR